MMPVECVNHCIDQAVTPIAIVNTLLFMTIFVMLFVGEISRFTQDDAGKLRWRRFKQRLTEPIRLFYLQSILSSVIMRD